MKLHFLIYVSIANQEFRADNLVELLQQSRERNEGDGITGMLLYKNRRFMQLLEGPETKVRETYARILRDPRHRDATVLLEGEAEEREFEDWSMGFQDLDDQATRLTPGYSPFLDTKISVFEFATDPSRAHQLLRIFRRI